MIFPVTVLLGVLVVFLHFCHVFIKADGVRDISCYNFMITSTLRFGMRDHSNAWNLTCVPTACCVGVTVYEVFMAYLFSVSVPLWLYFLFSVALWYFSWSYYDHGRFLSFQRGRNVRLSICRHAVLLCVCEQFVRLLLRNIDCGVVLSCSCDSHVFTQMSRQSPFLIFNAFLIIIL